MAFLIFLFLLAALGYWGNKEWTLFFGGALTILALFFASNELLFTVNLSTTNWGSISAIAVAATVIYIAKQTKATEVMAKSAILPRISVFLRNRKEQNGEIKQSLFIVNSDTIPGYVHVETEVYCGNKRNPTENSSDLLAREGRPFPIDLKIMETQLPRLKELLEDLKKQDKGDKEISATLKMTLVPFFQKEKEGVSACFEKKYKYNKKDSIWEHEDFGDETLTVNSLLAGYVQKPLCHKK